jgi:catechol 2,3-dioxygenase-like lactoylglutathione lyase family enzyme
VKFALDHVVIAVGDLERTIADYRALGFTVVPGGRHPGRTSHNALVVFEDGAYLELIAWTAPNAAERWNVEHVKHGDGFMDFALIPEDVPRAIAEAQARGLVMNGPIDGGRVRPDGRELKWQTARQTTFDLPFLCGDVTPRELRVPEGDARRHDNGALGVSKVVVAVKDLEASRKRYSALLGSDALTVAGCEIVLATSAEDAGQGLEAARRLEARGEGPCAIEVETLSGRAGRLDLALSHRALIIQNGGSPREAQVMP